VSINYKIVYRQASSKLVASNTVKVTSTNILFQISKYKIRINSKVSSILVSSKQRLKNPHSNTFCVTSLSQIKATVTSATSASAEQSVGQPADEEQRANWRWELEKNLLTSIKQTVRDTLALHRFIKRKPFPQALAWDDTPWETCVSRTHKTHTHTHTHTHLRLNKLSVQWRRGVLIPKHLRVPSKSSAEARSARRTLLTRTRAAASRSPTGKMKCEVDNRERKGWLMSSPLC